MFHNWKTSLAGIAMGVAGAAGALQQQPGSVGRISGLVFAFSSLLLGLLAKDGSK